MAVTAQQLIDEFLGQWSFDISTAEALVWLDRRHKKMVRRSRCNLKTVTVGTTTAGTSDYAMKAIEVFQVLVDGVPYGKAPRRTQNDYARSRVTWTPADEGLFVSTADSNGVSEIGLIPTPDATGKTIAAFAAMPATDLSLGSSLLIDDDFHEQLQEGMAATGYARDPEQIPVADRCEARFDAGCEEYRREIKRRMRSGPATIRLR